MLGHWVGIMSLYYIKLHSEADRSLPNLCPPLPFCVTGYKFGTVKVLDTSRGFRHRCQKLPHPTVESLVEVTLKGTGVEKFDDFPNRIG